MDSRRERITVFAFLIVGILCFIALWRPEYFGFGNGHTRWNQYVGELKRREGEIRYKSSGEIVWHEMTDDRLKVSDGDTIYTGATGTADLSLDMGTQATILPNSMVVIRAGAAIASAEKSSWLERLDHFLRPKREVSHIAFQSGSIHINGVTREHPVELEVNGSSYRVETLLSKASVDLSIPPVTDRQSGRISLTAAPTAQVSLVSLTEPSKTPIVANSFVVHLTPVSTRIFDDEHFEYVPIKLGWSNVPQAKNYRVRVFHGDRAMMEQVLSDTGFQFRLTALDKTPYYYQVSAVLGSGVELASEKTKIEIEIAPPRLTLPELATFLKKNSAFVIAWERTLLTSKYQVQVAADRDFKKLRVDRQTGSNAFPFRPRESGSLYVRVKSLSPELETPWSKPLELRVH